MTIATRSALSSGLQPQRQFAKQMAGATGGVINSAWLRAGKPATGVADTSTANGVARSSSSSLVTGQIPHYDPTGGASAYVANLRFWSGAFNGGGSFLLLDRLWDCGANSAGSALSPTLLTAQTVNSATWPARDENGSTNGVGVYIALEVSSNLGAGSSGWTLSYTNSSGSSGKSGSNTLAQVSATGASGMYLFGLAAGDVGVQSVQSITNNATDTSGQYLLVAIRVLAVLELISLYEHFSDAISLGFPKIQNGAVPFFGMKWPAGANFALLGALQEGQG